MQEKHKEFFEIFLDTKELPSVIDVVVDARSSARMTLNGIIDLLKDAAKRHHAKAYPAAGQESWEFEKYWERKASVCRRYVEFLQTILDARSDLVREKE